MSNPEDVTMPFGKHQGKTLGDILAEDPGYLKWLNETAKLRADRLRDAVEETCEKYEREIYGIDAD